MNIDKIQNNYYYAIGKTQANSTAKPVSCPVTSSAKPAFTANATQSPLTLRTELINKEEVAKYSQLTSFVDKESKKQLKIMLQNGLLLNSKSNNNSTILDNLYKIMTTQRAPGLDPKVILKETINTITNPYVITQQFGDIPKNYVQKALEIGHANEKFSKTAGQIDPKTNKPKDEINEKTIDVRHSGACVAASIEFNLASQMPAEFVRFTEGLTSPNVSVDKTIKTKNLANNTLDAIWLLNAFEVPYKMDNFDEAKLTLAPDKNALFRAQVQNSNKDKYERSLVDVLMQSTFMNVGSQQAYNSLTDVRGGKFNQEDKGLIEFEKTFTESIVEDKNKVSITYQIVDDNAKLTGYETDFNTMKKHILDSLAMGENVIIGYTQTDDKNTIINGHEITIIGVKKDRNDKLIFICNDTDDNKPNQIEYPEDYIIPKIHHAGLPQKVVEKDVHFVDNWVQGIESYKEAKKNPQSATNQKVG